MNSIGTTLIALLATVTLCASRRMAALALLGGVLFLTNAQVLNVTGINLFPMRLLEICAGIRIFVRGDVFSITWNTIDRLLFALYAYTIAVFCWRSEVERSFVLGVGVDATLCYLAFRALVQGTDDLEWILRKFALALIPYVGLLVVEMSTGENPFRVIGGTTFVERGGRLRCMGSFRHPSLLGTLGAAFLPLYAGLMHSGPGRFRALTGAALCVAIVLLANSGGPLAAAAVGGLGWLLWPLRRHMASVRRALLGLLLLIWVAMKPPIWYLPAKASSASGGDGWHRSYLMDVAFRELDTWWLAGIDMARTKNWFDYTLASTGSADITNQYLFFGLTAGLPAILFFVWLLIKTFSALGMSLKAERADPTPDAKREAMLWALGCSTLVHMATWFGITYTFDQTYVLWLVQLAAISSITTKVRSVVSPGAEQPQATFAARGSR